MPAARITSDAWFARMPWIDQAADAEIAAYCGKNAEPLFDLKEKLTAWRDDGVVIFENAVPLDVIDAFSAQLDALIEHPEDFFLEIDDAGVRRPLNAMTASELRRSDTLKINDVHNAAPAALLLSLSPVIVNFMKHVFQDTPCAFQTLAFNKGSQQPAHADFAYIHIQRDIPFMGASWIPLEDISPDAGPLAYYPGTHRVANFGFYDFGNGEIIRTDVSDLAAASRFGQWLERRIDAGEYPRKVFLPKKGALLIWHAALVHGGARIKDSTLTRRSLVTHYTSRNMLPEFSAIFDSESGIEEFRHNGGIALASPARRRN